MRIVRIHVDFWRSRQQEPRWIGQFFGQHPKAHKGPSIHAVINSNAGISLTDGERAAQSVLNLVRHDIRWLKLEAIQQETPINPEKRQAFAKKWLKRLKRDIDHHKFIAEMNSSINRMKPCHIK